MSIKVSIGPYLTTPSWAWVGFDACRELANYFDVATWDNSETIPACDVAIIIKEIPDYARLLQLKETGTKLIFFPIDYYRSEEDLVNDQRLLLFDGVVCHSRGLRDIISRFVKRTISVEHHNHFTLPQMATWKEDGFILWVGQFKYAAYLLDWLRRHPIDREIRLISNPHLPYQRKIFNRFANQMCLPIPQLKTKSDKSSIWLLGPYEVAQWTERVQMEWMQEAKAAIDIKGTEWHQQMKPATKSQQFVSSGIPFAVNDAESRKFFSQHGFELASPTDPKRWFSYEYWEETVVMAQYLRRELTLEKICEVYRNFIAELLQA